MRKIDKLLRASDDVRLPAQDTYVLAVNKTFYLLQTVVAWGVAVVLFLSAGGGEAAGGWDTYYWILCAVMALYGLAALYCAFTRKATFDNERITIPGFYPFMTEKLAWDDIDRAELTGVITYRSYIALIFKKIFASFFAHTELHVTRRSAPGVAAANFPVLERVADRKTALRIIRDKLGKRFTVYEGKY
ncbi:hypothetical protein [Rikenella microfusus]|uniref:hypothetical protein n=1 Tax=Rikenella microfusus TaxID=28139 RepID=UPI003A9495EF